MGQRTIEQLSQQWDETILRVYHHYLKQFGSKTPERFEHANIPYQLERLTSEYFVSHPRKIQFIILSGASGSGKGTIGRELQKRGITHLPRLTTRKPRPGELNGQDYFFVSDQEFERLRDEGKLINWAITYGEYRGVSQDLLIQYRQQGKPFYIEGSTKAYHEFITHQEVKKTSYLSIEILPPSFSILKQRLKLRNDNIAQLEFVKRLENAVDHVRQTTKFPYDAFVVNDKLDRVVKTIIRYL